MKQSSVLRILCICILAAAGASFAHAQTTPVPFLNLPLVPGSAVPGGAAFTLTVNGTGFVTGSVVDWNGSPRTTTFVSASQVTASILSTDVAAAGTANVTVSNPAGETSQPALFDVTIPSSSIGFARSDINFTNNCSISGVVTGDFNGDGKTDIVECGFDASQGIGLITAMLGNGDGTFTTGPTTSVPGMLGPSTFVAADINNDGKLDLVGISCFQSGNIGLDATILLGNGDGTFQQPYTLETGGVGPPAVAVGDFNGDGHLDLALVLACANTDCNNSGLLSIYLGNGDGTLQNPITYLFPGDIPGSGLVIGDFNGDGRLDVATSYGPLVVYLGNGDGSFQNPYTVLSSGVPYATADLNGDGKLDLVTSAGILLGNGDGTFGAPLSNPPGDYFSFLGDVNGDGKLDLVQDNLSLSGASVLFGNGDGTFQAPINFPLTAPDNSYALAVGDFNNDGRLDVAAAGAATLSILLQTTVQLPTAPIDFGNVAVAATSPPQSVTLTNLGTTSLTISSIVIGGTNPGDFVIQSNTCGTGVAAGASCAVGVTFTPALLGTRSALLIFTDSGPASPQSVMLTGVGVPNGSPPVVSLSTTSLTFPVQAEGTTSAAQNITLTNTGGSALTINGLTFTGTNPTDFGETSTCGSTVQPGATCTISVTFTPSGSGGFSAILNVFDNAANSPQTVTLAGTGTGPAVTLTPASLTFASQVIGTTSPAQTVTLTNTGGATLTLSTVTITGTNSSDFIPANTCPGSIASGASCSILVTFKPTASGTRTASLTLTDSATNSPQNVPLTGTGTAAAIVTLTPTSLTFAPQLVGTTSAALTATLANTGATALTISGVTITGTNSSDFAQTNTCGTSLAAGASCTISVTDTPASAITSSATLNVADNAMNSPQQATLAGNGTDITAPVLVPTSLTLTQGQMATFVATSSPVNGFKGSYVFSCAGAPLNATCTAGTATVNANGSASATFTVTTLLPSAAPGRFKWPADGLPETLWLLLLGMIVCAMLAMRQKKAAWQVRRSLAAIALALALGGFGLLAACGGGGTASTSTTTGTPVGTYPLTVTVATGSRTHSTTLNLVVNAPAT